MRIRLFFFALLFVWFKPAKEETPFIMVLGIAQDAGYPQAGCTKECCSRVYNNKQKRQMVSSLALVDPSSGQKWIFDATPDFTQQLYNLNKAQTGNLSGIFLTHAHIGHYTGLMYLGKEAQNTASVPVYAMPRMHDYLLTNGPWSQLMQQKNIVLQKLKADSIVYLTKSLSVQPVLVPHRDEYSETVGYLISAGKKSVLFIPDIDKWNRWERSIEEYIKRCDYLFLDGTFYKESELPGRNMADIPHPFVQESIKRFETFSAIEKKKIWFIHFNHTNPLLNPSSAEYKKVKQQGYNISSEGMKVYFD